MIENTNDEQAMARFMLDALFTNRPGSGDAVLSQEARGQAQLVRSESLPSDTRNADEEFTVLGFTFGEPDPADPLFRPATLPEGWTKRATEHSMWSEIVDDLGRVRVQVFYKAAFYDRCAFMRIETVESYAYRLMRNNETPILDDTWATRDAIVAALVGAMNDTYESAETRGRAQSLIESLA